MKPYCRQRPANRRGRRNALGVRHIPIMLLGCFCPLAAGAQEFGVSQPPIENFYGQVGLLDMPSARFQRDGEISATVSTMQAVDRYSIGFQALPWLETAFRYSRLDTYRPNFDLYDRSLGVKVRLVQEHDVWPQLAIGAQDVLGTGAFSGEYLVGSKRAGDLDFTFGIGWRRLAGLAPFNNPLGEIFKSFDTVPNDINGGGRPLVNQFFHGPKAGLFGGVTWATPVDGLSLIFEASGDAYDQQVKSGALKVRTPLNIGFSYEPWKGLQIGGGYLYGSQFGLRATMHFNAEDQLDGPRLGEPPVPPKVRSSEARNDAVLALLQNATHYYDNWPARTASTRGSSTLSRAEKLTEAVYQVGDSRKFIVQAVETYGKSLIITIPNRASLPLCDELPGLAQTALSSGFVEIRFRSQRSRDARTCELNAQQIAQYADWANPVREIQADAPSSVDQAPAEPPASGEASKADIETRIVQAAINQKLGITALSVGPHEIEVAYLNNNYESDSEAIGRLLRILMAEAPPHVEIFRVVSMIGTVPVSSITFSRSDVERTLNMYGTAGELLPLTAIKPVSEYDPLLIEHTRNEFPTFGFSVSPGYHQSLFDPNSPFQVEFYASLAGAVTINKHLTISASVEASLFSTFNFQRESDSVLPHVRSDFAKYIQKGKNGIGTLEATYVGKLSPEVYYTAEAGYLEDMFAGFGGEIYWQPQHTRWAIGGSLYGVEQRNFDRLFGLRDYRVITGHLSLYYDSPFYGLDFAVHAGRYLAGDYGATFQVTRRFDNGIEIGAYATLTNVPFSQFGEGSFDKGIIIHIPIADLLPVNTQDEYQLDFSPLTRDGGQRLLGESTLHSSLQRSSEGEILKNWDEVLHP